METTPEMESLLLKRITTPTITTANFSESETQQLHALYIKQSAEKSVHSVALGILVGVLILELLVGLTGWWIFILPLVLAFGYVFRAAPRHEKSFRALAPADRFTKMQAFFTLRQEKTAADERKKQHARIINTVLGVGAAILAVMAFMTTPDKARHEQEIRATISRDINDMPINNVGDAAGNVLARAANSIAQDKLNINYIDTLGLTYDKFGVFSVVRDTRPGSSKIISWGLFNQVFVNDENLR